MQTRQLGKSGPLVSALGLGCMGMSNTYGVVDEKESIATIHAALDAGITLLDTGDFYGMGHNEMLIGKVLQDVPRDKLLLSVKFGAMRDPKHAFIGYDGRPTAVKNFLAYTLQRLRTDYVDIYRPARLDPKVPIEETVGAIVDLKKAGFVRYIGLSEVGSETLRRAKAVHEITDLQIEYSLVTRGIENKILNTCRKLGISITAYGVLSRSLLSGELSKDQEFYPGDIRARFPRFSKENLNHNLAVVDALREIAKEKGCTVAQLAIAWIYSRGEDIIPLIGTSKRKHLSDSLAAIEIKFSADDFSRIKAAIPSSSVVGDRYAPALMAELDSEKNA
jgi:aryl-alcohol dehydrogenase-like predicted oxidoreductase